MPLDYRPEQLEQKLCRTLRISGGIQNVHLVKQSVDARRKSDLHLVLSVDVEIPDEAAIAKRLHSNHVRLLTRQPYQFPPVVRNTLLPPVVVGTGPAGLFAALYLARNGIPSVVLERGAPVEERTRLVERFWQTGSLDPATNVQFGEGGAGTFSDGKLTTGTHDARIGTVLDTFIEMGAPADIAHSFRPHVGTDILRQVVRQIRLELIRLGSDVRFGHQVTGFQIESGQLHSVTVSGPDQLYQLETDALILAPGHSARDTFALLRDSGVPMEPKPFAIGVRIEHHQEAISRAQYGAAWNRLPPSDYRLSCHLPSGRSAFSFCVCPGGTVVASASSPGYLVTNGMSYRARDGKNINGGLLVGVTPADFPDQDVLSGVRFQERWEQLAYEAGGGGFRAPAQLAGDFLSGRASAQGGPVAPTYRPGVTWTDLRCCLPAYAAETLRDALPLLDRKVHGFAASEAVLTGVETRSSSPVRVLRDERCQSAVRGIFPCGEGCGYAGGIMSAAVDGIRVAESVAQL